LREHSREVVPKGGIHFRPVLISQINAKTTGKEPPISSESSVSEEFFATLDLEKGVIQISRFPFGASSNFATKADGSLRLGIDYHCSEKDTTSLSSIGELRDRLGYATVFSA
jgi:hypothetical protein